MASKQTLRRTKRRTKLEKKFEGLQSSKPLNAGELTAGMKVDKPLYGATPEFPLGTVAPRAKKRPGSLRKKPKRK